MKMKKRKVVLAFLSTLVMAASYASYKQNVQLCLKVSGNTSSNTFVAHFESSDVFDILGTRIKPISNGEKCASHTYSREPKNIRLNIGLDSYFHGGNLNDVLITLDSSCSFMYNEQSGLARSEYQKTSHENEFWNFDLTQSPPVKGYKYAYNLICQHSSS